MPKVHITTDDLTIDVKDGYALIDMCEDHDTSILFGCRDGACGAWCRGSILMRAVWSERDFKSGRMARSPDHGCTSGLNEIHESITMDASDA